MTRAGVTSRLLGFSPKVWRLFPLVAMGALLLAPACSHSKRDAPGSRKKMLHPGGIPVIPRGKVTLSAARGERYLLEIVAPVEPSQALAFYRRQLAREQWGELQVQRVEKGLWGLEARRGMFVLTGRIKALGPHKTSIGFERRVRSTERAWSPPVQPDVPLLPGTIVWQERVFDAGDSRVELRGRSPTSQKTLLQALRDGLTRAGWTLTPSHSNAQIRAERKILHKKPRVLIYQVDSTRAGARIRLWLSLDELTAGARPTAAAPARRPGERLPPTSRRASAAARDTVPVPAPLRIFQTKTPPLARRLSSKVTTVTFERPCTTIHALRIDVERRLRKQGWKLLPRPRIAADLREAPTDSVTATRGRLLLVALVSREIDGCVVTLTSTQK